jgi:hypothetical protein
MLLKLLGKEKVTNGVDELVIFEPKLTILCDNYDLGS